MLSLLSGVGAFLTDQFLKSQVEKDDEGVKYCELKGAKLGFYWMSLIYAIVAVTNFIIVFIRGGEMLGFYIASSMYFCFLASEAYTKHKFTAERKWKVYSVTGIISSIAFFVNWFVRIMWP